MDDSPGRAMEGPSGGSPDSADAPTILLDPPPAPEELAAFPLLASLPLEALAGLARSLRTMHHPAGSPILVQGERADRMHFLRAGKVRVEIDSAADVRIPVAELGPGDCFGEMSLLTGEPASAHVTALDEVESLALDRSAFNELATRNPGLLRDFTTLISRRLRKADEAFVSSRVKEREVTRFLRDDPSGQFSVLVGKDRATRSIEKRVAELAAGDDPVLLLGERGTGKELLARRIHYGSPRREQPLLSVDCDRVAETQWGDSLFGDYHRKDGRPPPRGAGNMHPAAGGTRPPNNIHDLPPAVMERLSRYLEREGTGGVRRRDVRILATGRGSTGGDGEGKGGLRGPPPVFGAATLAIPPLRERKKDIPDLARHFLEKHAKRLGLPPRTLDDRAVAKLVTHDFAQGNVTELEEAMRRALVLSEGGVIGPDEIFLVRPGAGRDRPGILKVPRPLLALAGRVWPGPARGAVALFFSALVLACLVPPSPGAGRAALVLIWALWWPALALSFLLLGRLWCALCPMASAGALVQRFSTGKRPVPAWLKEKEPVLLAGGFFAILFVEEITDMRHSPLATGLLLLAILAGAVAASFLWPRRTWCRHLCPLGGLAGACATTSMLEVRSTPDLCEAKCTGHMCYKGADGVPGCPMFHHVMFLDTNRDCILCLDCVKACPNGSPQVLVTLPAQELWHDHRSRPEVGWIAALLQGLLPALALIPFWERVHAEPFSTWLQDRRAAVLAALFVLFPAVPLAILRLRRRPPPGPGAEREEARTWTRVSAWLPLVAAGFAAYQASWLPGMTTLETSVGLDERTVLSSPILPLVQGALLTGGLLLSLWILLRQHPPGEEGRGRGALLDTGMAAAGFAGWFVLLLLLLAGASTAAVLGPWGVGALYLATGVTFRLSLGWRGA